MLLQLLDDGRLTDSAGRVVNFASTIVIATSNVGAEALLAAASAGAPASAAAKQSVMASLRRTFRPEFLNRLDGASFLLRRAWGERRILLTRS